MTASSVVIGAALVATGELEPTGDIHGSAAYQLVAAGIFARKGARFGDLRNVGA
jgi:hypothetical protein